VAAVNKEDCANLKNTEDPSDASQGIFQSLEPDLPTVNRALMAANEDTQAVSSTTTTTTETTVLGKAQVCCCKPEVCVNDVSKDGVNRYQTTLEDDSLECCKMKDEDACGTLFTGYSYVKPDGCEGEPFLKS